MPGVRCPEAVEGEKGMKKSYLRKEVGHEDIFIL
jgi:hypothetical protein